MKVLLPTKNKLKIEKWGGLIKELGYELLTLNDLSESFDEPKEDGLNVAENALKKAEYYYKKTGIVTIATDSSLYINGLSEKEQIGLFAGRAVVRNDSGEIISERALTDDENYERLKKLIEKLGSNATGYFEESIVIYYGINAYDSKTFIMNREFRAPGSEVRKEKAPMRSFTYYEDLDKYRSEMTNEEANSIEGETFNNQKEFLTDKLNKADHLMDYNFNLLIDRITECKNKMTGKGLREKLQGINGPCYCIGSGGSSAASLFSSLVLKGRNKIITVDKAPRDILYEELSLFRNLFAVSYSNKNHGISTALREARGCGLNTYVLTNNPSEGSIDNIIFYKTFLEKEYSFISMASTFMPMTIMLMYYLDIDNENHMNELLRSIYDSAGEVTHEIDKEDEIFEIMTGDNTYVASKILKSSIAESGIGIPVDSEKYEYCHGLSNLTFYHPNTTLIYLKNGKNTELDLKLLSEVSPYYKRVIVLQSKETDKIIGEFDLAMKALFLCRDIANAKGQDLSKLKYSPVVKKIYKYKGDM